jgi:hypothetical protein
MRLVYAQDESRDKTPGQKALRKLFSKSPKQFISQLAGLEKAHRAGASKERGATSEQPDKKRDLGSERCKALIEELLERLAKTAAEEDARLAARPDAPQISYTLQKHLTEALRRESVLREQLEELRRAQATGASALPSSGKSAG